LAAALLSAWLGVGCGSQRFIVVGTVKAPSASGFVEIHRVGKSGTEFTVHMEQLHPASQLEVARKSYVVWVQAGAEAPARLGVLRYNPDQRVGELRTRAPYRRFVVKITAEASNTPSAPSDFVVASEEIKVDD
jgi:hypothetical protein